MGDWKSTAFEHLGKVLSSDAAQKLMTNPQVQAAVVKAFNLQSEVREVVGDKVKAFASAFDLVTREDVATLRRKVRDLEDAVEELKTELEATRGPEGEAAAPSEPERKPRKKK